MANIKENLNNIKNALFGKDVRQSIHDAIEQCYNDASVNGNANMEVEMARGTYDTLGKRLDNSEEKISVFIDELSSETRTKRLQGENTKNDIKGTFDSANFAGQEMGKNAPIGNVMHHYTDGICFQVDNVGEDNNILILKNAYNPSRRPDKSEDFIGTGTFLECIKAVIGSTSLSMFRVDKDGNLIWADKNNKVEFISNKDDDGKAVFSFKNYKEHQKLFEIINAGLWEFTISHQNGQCVVQSGNNATNGLKLESVLGKVELSSASTVEIKSKNKGNVDVYGILRIQEGSSEYNRVVTVRSGATAGRPTEGLYIGRRYFDSSLGTNGKFIDWNGTDWIDGNGNIV